MSTAPTARLRRIQRTSLTLIVVSGIVNYMDRSALAIANPLIREELGLSVGEMGVLLSAFLWAYSFAQLPMGGLVDRIRPRRILTAGLLFWSGAQALGGIASGLRAFAATRVLLGIGESPQFPTCVRVVRDWFSVRDRGLPTGLFAGSSAMGTAISAPLLTFLMLQYGWRAMFIGLGVAGMLLGIVWWSLYRDVEEVDLTPQERAYLLSDEPVEADVNVTAASWLRLLRAGPTWGLLLGFFGTMYLAWLYMAWLPGYLAMDRQMSLPKVGVLAAIPYAFQVLGALSGGLSNQWITRRGIDPLLAAKMPVVGGVLGMALFTLLTSLVASNALAIASLSAAMFLGGVSTACAWTLICVIAPRSYVGSLAGMKNFGGYFGGALAPMVTGYVVQFTGSFRLALLIGATIGPVSGAVYWFGVRRRITVAELTR